MQELRLGGILLLWRYELLLVWCKLLLRLVLLLLGLDEVLWLVLLLLLWWELVLNKLLLGGSLPVKLGRLELLLKLELLEFWRDVGS